MRTETCDKCGHLGDYPDDESEIEASTLTADGSVFVHDTCLGEDAVTRKGEHLAKSERYTREEAVEYVRSCSEDDGPEDYEQAAALFLAIYGRTPDDGDGDQCSVWSLVCAGAEEEQS